MPNYVSLYQDYELSNQADYGRPAETVKRTAGPRRSSARVRRTTGSQNGIHRRRRKRWSW